MITLILALLLAAAPPQDHSDKRCVVTEVVREGIRSDCTPWNAKLDNPGERIFMSDKVRKQLTSPGQVFYYVWTPCKENESEANCKDKAKGRWEATLPEQPSV
jgi:hypothetical protein